MGCKKRLVYLGGKGAIRMVLCRSIYEISESPYGVHWKLKLCPCRLTKKVYEIFETLVEFFGNIDILDNGSLTILITRCILCYTSLIRKVILLILLKGYI